MVVGRWWWGAVTEIPLLANHYRAVDSTASPDDGVERQGVSTAPARCFVEEPSSPLLGNCLFAFAVVVKFEI